jgi:Pregnancy-associated plasma protein-A
LGAGSKRARRIVAAITLSAAAAVAGAFISPGAAHSAGASAPGLFCADGAELFSALHSWSASSTARATKDLNRERNTEGIVPDSNIPKGAEPNVSASFTATIPVWFHVVAAGRSPRQGWVSDTQVTDQIRVLNETFAGQRGGADTGFRFTLAGTTRTINAGWFAQETFQQEIEMKSALKRGDATTLNIYSTSGGGALGWAYLPKIVIYDNFQVLDGVVVHFGSLPGGSVANFNLGFTATHEAGHWLGLVHTFDGGCQGHGDYVEDTPAMSIPTSGCPLGKDTCPEQGLDPIHNYMDYSHDACYTEFTAVQSGRMDTQYVHWRVQHGY